MRSRRPSCARARLSRRIGRRSVHVLAAVGICLVLGTGSAQAVSVSLSGSTLTVAYTATDATTETATLTNNGTNIVVDATGHAQATFPVGSVTRIAVTRVAGAGSAQTLGVINNSGSTWALPDGLGGTETDNLAGITLSGSFSVGNGSLYAPVTLFNSTSITSSGGFGLEQINGRVAGAQSFEVSAAGELLLSSIGDTTQLGSLTVANSGYTVFLQAPGQSGVLVATSGAQSYTGLVRFAAESTLLRASTLTASGTFNTLLSGTASSKRLTIEQTGSSTISSTFEDGGKILDFEKAGTGTLTLTGSNTYTGTTTATGGVLRAGHATAFGATSTGATVDASGRLEVDAGISTAEPLTTTAGATLGAGGSGGAFTGALTMNGATTVDVPASMSLTMGASVSGTTSRRTLTKTGAGTLIRAGTATNLKTAVAAGTVQMNAVSATGNPVTVASGAQVTLGAGTYLNTTVWELAGGGAGQGAALQPVVGSNATVQGAISLSAAATIGSGTGSTLTLAGPVDSLPSTGPFALTLAGPGAITASGAIGDGDAIDPDVVPLASVSASAPLTMSGGVIRTSGAQSYAGGLLLGANLALASSGLTAAGGITTAGGVPSATVTVSQTGGSTITGGITGGVALVKDGGGTLTIGGTNSYTGATTLTAGVLRAGSATAFGATSAGTTVAADAMLDVAAGIASAEPLTVTTNSLLAASGTGAALNGAITLNGTPEVQAPAAGTFTLGGVISGASGLKLTGAGTVILGGTNTYTGTTSVDAGSARAANNAAFGNTSTGTTVAGGAHLEIAGGVALSESPILSASSFLAASGSGTATLYGSATLLGDVTISVPDGLTLQTSGVFTGAGAERRITKVGAGALERSGMGINLAMTITDGSMLASPDAVGSAVTIASGAHVIATTGTYGNAWTISGAGGTGQTSALRVNANQNATLNGAITLLGDAAVGAGVDGVLTVAGAVDATSGTPSVLTLTSLGTGVTRGIVKITGDVGATVPPASLTSTAKLSLAGNVTTTGAQTFDGTTTLTDAGATLTASAVTGSGSFANGRSPAGATTLTLDQSSDGTFAGTIGIAAGTSAERNIALVKRGSGALTLSGANAMTGAVDLQAGSIMVGASASLATSGVTAAAGTSVNGAGTISGPIAFIGSGGGAFVRSATSTPAILTTGAITGVSGRNLSILVDAATTAGTGYSQLNVVGAIDVSGMSLWTSGYVGTVGDTITIVHASGGVSGQFTTGTSYGAWRVDYLPNDVNLVYVGIPPTIDSVSPATGSISGGEAITLRGLHFRANSAVTLGGAPCAPVVFVSSVELRCTTAAHAAGSVAVSVSNEAGTTTAAGAFTFAAPGPTPDPSPASTSSAATGGGSGSSTRGAATAAVARPRFIASRATVATAVTTTGAGRLTQVITSKRGGRTVVRCSLVKAVGSGKAMVSCRLNAAARTAMKSGSLKLTVTTTWTPIGGAAVVTRARLTAPRA
jgi:autotransporter-associated beta strand protein